MKKLSSSKAKEILKDGTVHGKELTPKQQRFMGAVAGGNATKPPPAKAPPPARTNLGGNEPPMKPKARDAPKAIGQRPLLPKTAAKIEKMRRGR